MPKSNKYTIIPDSILKEYMANRIPYNGFVSHKDGSSSCVISEQNPIKTEVSKGEYEIELSCKYNICKIPALPNDAIYVHATPVYSYKYKSHFPLDTDRNKGKHTVRSGDTIELLSKQYGVTTDVLKSINDGKLPQIGLEYNVFPEMIFGNYSIFGDGSQPGEAEFYHSSSILMTVVADFLFNNPFGKAKNMIIGGEGVREVAEWDVVKRLVEDLVNDLENQSPGASTSRMYQPYPLISSNIDKTYPLENLRKKINSLFGDSTPTEDFFSPVHYIGSFGISGRLDAGGNTATICLYDYKSFSSLTDNKLKSDIIRSTYQRYIWTVTVRPSKAPFDKHYYYGR